jgi:hypothetical protein
LQENNSANLLLLFFRTFVPLPVCARVVSPIPPTVTAAGFLDRNVLGFNVTGLIDGPMSKWISTTLTPSRPKGPSGSSARFRYTPRIASAVDAIPQNLFSYNKIAKWGPSAEPDAPNATFCHAMTGQWCKQSVSTCAVV